MNRRTGQQAFGWTMLTLIAATLLFSARPGRAATPDPARQLAAARQTLAQLDAYRFTTHMIESVQPAAVAGVSARPTERHLHIEGASNRRAGQFELNVWDSLALEYDAADALQIRRTPARVEGRAPGGTWQALDDALNITSTADGVVYLDAAHHVSDATADDGTRYLRFLIDSAQLGNYLRRELQAYLQMTGQLPAGSALSDAGLYAQALGSGNLWLDATGRPRSLFVKLAWPVAADGTQTTLLIQSDFSAYEALAVTPLDRLQARLASAFVQIDWRAFSSGLLLIGVTLALLWLVVSGRRQLVYRLFALVMASWLGLSPLASLVQAQVNARDTARYPLLQAAEREARANDLLLVSNNDNALVARMRAQGRQDLRAPLPAEAPPQARPFDSTRAPLPAPGERTPAQITYTFSEALTSDAVARAPLATDNDEDGLDSTQEATWLTSDSNPDSDGDGLDDGQEVKNCPEQTVRFGLSSDNRADFACSDPTDSDTDNDGLTDGEEYLYIGTFVNMADSDGDGIADKAEVDGFMVGATRRYSNPTAFDSDGDGLADGDECPQLTVTPIVAPCQDSDGDGNPDIFDDDSDNDGVYDGVDSSPFHKLPASGHFDRDNPFTLTINNMAAQQVVVDLIVNPLDPAHLGYRERAIDWPSGDTAGQLQRRLDTTFPGMGGDVRAVPMLEFTFPAGSSGLPRTTASLTLPLRPQRVMGSIALINRPQGDKISDIFDSDRIDIQVQTLDSAGSMTLAIYAATCAQVGAGTAGAAAFSAVVTANSVHPFNGTNLSAIANGAHVIALTDAANGETRCVPIARLAEGPVRDGTSIGALLVRARDNLGDLTLTQSGGNIALSAIWQPAQQAIAHSVLVVSGSCTNRGAQLASAALAAGATSASFSNRTLTTLANGSNSLIVRNGSGREQLCMPLPNVINGSAAETTMIDLAKLGEYNISVSENDAAGELVASVPLRLLTDAPSGRRSGFGAQLVLDGALRANVSATTRMVWWVEALTDNCYDPPADFLPASPLAERLTAFGCEAVNRPQVVHRYDDQWILGSVSAREERGTRVLMVHENPATDASLTTDDYLWKLAYDLDEVFVGGVDCSASSAITSASCANSNNVVDVAIDQISGRMSSWGYPNNIFSFSLFTAPTQVASAAQMAAAIGDKLTTTFTSGGQPITEAPLLLFAREDKLRALAMGTPGHATLGGSALTLDFKTGGAALVEVSVHSLNWQAFRSVQGQWQAFDPADYLALLEARLSTLEDFSGGATTLEQQQAGGKLQLAKLMAGSLLAGSSRMVAGGGLTLYPTALPAVTPTDANRSAQLASFVGGGLHNGEIIHGLLTTVAAQMYARFQQFERSEFRLDREALKLPPGSGASGRARGLLEDLPTLAPNAARLFAELDLATTSRSSRAFARWTLKIADNPVISKIGLGSAATTIVGATALSVLENALGDSIAAQVSGVILNAILVVQSTLDAFIAVGQAIALSGKAGYVNLLAAAKAAAEPASTISKVMGVAGVVLAIGVAWGAMIWETVANGVAFYSTEFNAAVANVIGQSVIIVQFAVLAAAGPIGLAVAAVIGAIDAIIAFACSLLDETQEESLAAQFICPGISGWLSQLIAFLIYANNNTVTIDDPYRMQTLDLDTDLVNRANGFVPGAALNVGVLVQNTLEPAPIGVNIGVTYGWQYSVGYLKSSVFTYSITTTNTITEELQPHNSYSRDTMNDAWVDVSAADGDDRQRLTRSASGDTALPAAGVNRAVPAWLAEAYVVPIQECWLIPAPPFFIPSIPVCYLRDSGATNYTDLNITIDVFPPTLGQFFALEPAGGNGQLRPAWGQDGTLRLAALLDADGDGLPFDTDSDDSTWDTDLDRIPDPVELKNNSSPLTADSDGDLIPDPLELLYGSNPARTDSDLDGASDKQELDGWLIDYGPDAGDRFVVYGNPRFSDEDGDQLLDGRERLYGFHPRIANDRNVLRFATSVVEPDAPLIHYTFEEPAGSTTFVDAASHPASVPASCVTDNAGTFIVIEAVRDRSFDLDLIQFTVNGNISDQFEAPFDTLAPVGFDAPLGSGLQTVEIQMLAVNWPFDDESWTASFSFDPATTPRNTTITVEMRDFIAGEYPAHDVLYRVVDRSYDCPTAAVTGVFGSGLLFDGVGDQLRLTNNVTLNTLRTNFTVSAWIWPFSIAGEQIIMATDPTSSADGFEFALRDGRLRFGWREGQFVESNAGLLAPNRWQHVIAEVFDPDGTGSYSVYFSVNGQDAGVIAGSLSGTPTPGASHLIGATFDEFKLVSRPFAGYLDDLVVYQQTAFDSTNINRGLFGTHNPNDLNLQPGQRLAINSTATNAAKRSLVGSFNIDFASGLTTAGDVLELFELGAGQTLQLAADAINVRADAATGRYAIDQDISGRIDDRPDRLFVSGGSTLVYQWSESRSFGGSSTLLSTNPLLDFDGNNGFTLSTWIFPQHEATDSVRRGILGRDSGRSDAMPYLQTRGDDLIFGFGSTSGVLREATLTDRLRMSQYNFIAVTYDPLVNANQVTFYIGNSANSATTAQARTLSNSGSGRPRDVAANQSFFIGRSNNRATFELPRVKLICEGDGWGDGEYHLINQTTATNHFNEAGTEVVTWTPNLSLPFVESATFVFCENDDSNFVACSGNDEIIATHTFSSNMPQSALTTVTNSNPPGKTTCSGYGVFNAEYPDVLEYDYRLVNESIPFLGIVQDIRVHNDALNSAAIGNLAANNTTVARFDLDEAPLSSSFADTIAYHNGTCNAALGQCPQSGVIGRENLAVQFDGSDDGIDADTVSKEAASSSNLTLSLWIYPTSSSGRRTAAAFRNAANSVSRGTVFVDHAGAPAGRAFIGYQDDQITIKTSNTLPVNRWHHVVVTLSSNGFGQMYVNSDQVGGFNSAFDYGSLPAADGRFTIGYHRNSSGTRVDAFQGLIDRVRIEKVHWDYSTMDLDYTGVPGYVNAMEEDAAANPFNWDPRRGVDGQVGRAWEFDGADDYVVLGILQNLLNPVETDLFRFTFGMWVRPESFVPPPGQTQTYLLKGSYYQFSDTVERLSLALDSLGRPTVYINGRAVSAPAQLAPNVWSHIAVAINDGSSPRTARIYINGALANDGAFNYTNNSLFMNTGDIRLQLGGDFGAGNYDGRIDEFFFYARNQLDQEQILKIYNLQNGWLGDDVQTDVTVGATPPQVTLNLTRDYLPALVRSTIPISATAAGVPLAHATLVIDGGSTLGASFNPASGVFEAAFESFPEGQYALQATAVDAVGNRATPLPQPAHIVWLDGTPPLLTLDPYPSPRRAATIDGKQYLRFSGTASDPTIAGTGQPGSGVASVAVALYYSGTQQLVNGTLETLPQAAAWSLDYPLITDNPTGSYDVELIVTDNVGNKATYTTSVAMAVDGTPPVTGNTSTSTRGADGRASSAPSFLNAASEISGRVDETPNTTLQHATFAGVQAVQTAFTPVLAHGSPFVNQALPAGTLLYLPLDEAARSADDPANSYRDLVAGYQANCTGSCPTAGVSGAIGGAAGFDGSGDYLSFGHVPAVSALTRSFTVAAWVKPAALDGTQRIVSTSRLASGDGFGLALVGDDTLRFTTYGVRDYDIAADLQVGRWTHVAAVMTAGDDVRFYLNGRLLGQVNHNVPASADANDPLLIGAIDGAANGEYFNGAIDDVLIVERVLNATEVRNLLGAAPTVHLTFDEQTLLSGRTLPNVGSVGGSAKLALATNLNADNRRALGQIGQGAMATVYSPLSGEFDVVTTDLPPGALPSGSEPFTLSIWGAFFSTDGGNRHDIYLDGQNSAFFFGPQELAFCTPANCVVGNNSIGLYTWHHIAFVYDGNQRILYLDGVEVGRDTPGATNQAGVAENGFMLFAGDGQVDDLRLYRRALPAVEIAALYAGGWQIAPTTRRSAATADWVTSPPAGLEGFYELQTRGVDNLLNAGQDVDPAELWRGAVDTLAPRVTIGTTGSGPFVYSLTATDFFLNPATLNVPLACDGQTVTQVSNYESAWYAALTLQQAATPAQPYTLTATCTVAAPLAAGDSFRVCDIAGNCTAVYANGTLVPTAVTLDGWQQQPRTSGAPAIAALALTLLLTLAAVWRRRRRAA